MHITGNSQAMESSWLFLLASTTHRSTKRRVAANRSVPVSLPVTSHAKTNRTNEKDTPSRSC